MYGQNPYNDGISVGFPEIPPAVLNLLALLIIFACIFFGDKLIKQTTCAAKTQNMQMESYYDWWAGCMVEVEPNHFIPLDNYYFKEE